MARDYKYRAQNPHDGSRGRRRAREKQGLSLWRWMLITALIIGFVVFLFYLASSGPEQSATVTAMQNSANTTVKIGKSPEKQTKPIKQKVEAPPTPEMPQFHFYQYLPKKEKVVPDYEIDTRAREERVGKAKTTRYLLQAEAYQVSAEADSLRAKLALMGIESRIEKTKVGSVTWHRVLLGPYLRMSSVSVLLERLKKSGIDAKVMEVGQ